MRKQRPTSNNFIEILLDLFGKSKDGDYAQKRMMKSITDQLRKQHKYYHLSTREVQPPVAKFFFDLYNTTEPTKLLLENFNKSNQLKNIVIESFLDEQRVLMINTLTPDSIDRRVRTTSAKLVKKELTTEYAMIENFLLSTTISNQINLSYFYLTLFNNFINFDFYFFIQQFDHNVPRNSIDYKPNFNAVYATLLVDDLNDFLELATPLAGNINWEDIFHILKNYRNTEIINYSAWVKSVALIKEFIDHDTFSLIIKHTKNDPFYSVKSATTSTDIVKPYVNGIKSLVNSFLQKIERQEQHETADKMRMDIFGIATIPVTLSNYTLEKSEILFNKNSTLGFIYTDPCNVIIGFYDDYLKKIFKNLLDLLILKGKWSQNNFYKDFSYSFEELLGNYEDITQFDHRISDDSTIMIRLRSALRAKEQDKSALNTIKGILGEINDDIKDLMQYSVQNYTVLARCLKTFIDDYKRQPHSEVILNWKEIQKSTDLSVGKTMVDLYTRIYYLIQLLQYYLRED